MAQQKQTQQRPPQGEARQLRISQSQGHRCRQEQETVRLRAGLLPLEQRLVVPGGEAHKHRPGQAGSQMVQRGERLEHIDAAHSQKEPRPRQGVEQGALQEPESLEGRGCGEDQDRCGQEGQRGREIQKQHSPDTGPQQGRDARRPRPAGCHAPQSKGGISPRRLAGGQRRRQKKAGAPGQQVCPPALQDRFSVPHSSSLLHMLPRRRGVIVGVFHHFTARTGRIPSGKESGCGEGAGTADSGLFLRNVI